nr:hypothetical protein [Streptomyces antimicrobicus]
MHRGLVHAFAWLLATGAAVTLSWWGVRTVMSGTAYDRPLAVPLTTRPLSSSPYGGDGGAAGGGAQPSASGPSASPSGAGTSSPSPTPSPSSSRPAVKPSAGRSADPSRDDGAGAGGEVKGYTVAGGRVVFALAEESAELVSATPAGGWRIQVWKQPYWIRVTFSRDGRESSVFCTWHDHAPTVQLDER